MSVGVMQLLIVAVVTALEVVLPVVFVSKAAAAAAAAAVGALLCAGVVIDTSIGVSKVGMRVDVLNLVFNMAVDSLMVALSGTIFSVATNVNADELVDVDAGIMAAFKFAMPDLLKECRC